VKRHPVSSLIREAAFHGKLGLPSRADLDELGLTPEQREAVRDACREVATINETGEHGAAWYRGDELAGPIVDGLPKHQRDPDYLTIERGRRESGISDPAALAALVPRY
jgi:hypothetical protein